MMMMMLIIISIISMMMIINIILIISMYQFRMSLIGFLSQHSESYQGALRMT